MLAQTRLVSFGSRVCQNSYAPRLDELFVQIHPLVPEISRSTRACKKFNCSTQRPVRVLTHPRSKCNVERIELRSAQCQFPTFPFECGFAVNRGRWLSAPGRKLRSSCGVRGLWMLGRLEFIPVGKEASRRNREPDAVHRHAFPVPTGRPAAKPSVRWLVRPGSVFVSTPLSPDACRLPERMVGI
jgi:hypothetical protein